MGKISHPHESRGTHRNVSGEPQIRRQLNGAWSQTDLNTRVELEQGSVKLEGADRYENVHLIVSVDSDQFRLVQLRAEASQARLLAHGKASRLQDALQFRYKLDLNAQRFPIPLDDSLILPNRSPNARIRSAVMRGRAAVSR